MEPNSLPFNAQQWRPNGKELWQLTLLLVLILLFGFACSLSYLPLCPSGRCWKAVQWSWKLPPGWSRDSGYVSHEVLWGHGLPLTSKSHQRRSGNKKEKKIKNDKSVKEQHTKNSRLLLLKKCTPGSSSCCHCSLPQGTSIRLQWEGTPWRGDSIMCRCTWACLDAKCKENRGAWASAWLTSTLVPQFHS